MLFELNEQQVKNLGVFLGRTEMKGAEVQSYAEIINLFNAPVDDKYIPKHDIQKEKE